MRERKSYKIRPETQKLANEIIERVKRLSSDEIYECYIKAVERGAETSALYKALKQGAVHSILLSYVYNNRIAGQLARAIKESSLVEKHKQTSSGRIYWLKDYTPPAKAVELIEQFEKNVDKLKRYIKGASYDRGKRKS
jgi:hypothetical protein